MNPDLKILIGCVVFIVGGMVLIPPAIVAFVKYVNWMNRNL